MRWGCHLGGGDKIAGQDVSVVPIPSVNRLVSAVSPSVGGMDEIEPGLTWDEKMVIVGVFVALTREPKTTVFDTPAQHLESPGRPVSNT